MNGPQLPLTVSESLWNAMAKDIRPEFADSYLSGAKQTASTLTPHTVTAYRRLAEHTWAKKIITRPPRLQVRGLGPLPDGSPLTTKTG